MSRGDYLEATAKSQAPLSKPLIERAKTCKALLSHLGSDAPARVLHALFHYAFLPTRGDIAKLRLKQVMAA
jgi:hypothetical protein